MRFTGHAALHRNTVITDDCKPSSITALDLRSSRPQMRPHRPAHVTASIKYLSYLARARRGYPGRAPARRNLFGVPSPPSERGPLSDFRDNCSSLTCAASQRCRSSCPTSPVSPGRSPLLPHLVVQSPSRICDTLPVGASPMIGTLRPRDEGGARRHPIDSH